MKSARPRLLCVSSGGGHWVELLRLKPAFVECHVAYATVSKTYAYDVAPARLHVVADVTRWNKLRWLLCVAQILKIIIRERPTVILSTGALPGYFALRLGRLLGKRTVWIDSFANADELSMSGQRAGKCADLWLTQWPHLARKEGPQCKGKVF